MHHFYSIPLFPLSPGAFNGARSSLCAHELGTLVIKEALGRAGVPASDVSEVIMGHVLTAGNSQPFIYTGAMAMLVNIYIMYIIIQLPLCHRLHVLFLSNL